jgi:N-acetylglucosamine-6-phosphate deacetylase
MATHILPEGAWLAPGFIDLQVNGGGDVLFNDQPTAQGIRTIAAAQRRFGTTGLLPTLITDSPEKTRLALDAPTPSRRRSRGYSESTSKGRICLPRSRGCMTRGRSGSRARTISRC